MPWPDFSELSFGFSFLREFERLHAPGGKFPSAPDFISQNDEADLGYDVEAALDGSAPVFFQFKRSYVLTTHRAKEIAKGHFASPDLYRMELRKKERYRQHKALRRLESAGNSVFYVTSQISDHRALTRAYMSGTVVGSAAALFSPGEINLPDEIGSHHVTFEAHANYGFVYSDQGTKFDRKFSQFGTAVQEAMVPRRQTVEQNRADLSAFVETLGARAPDVAGSWTRGVRELANRFESPAIKASIFAFFLLDAQMTLFRE